MFSSPLLRWALSLLLIIVLIGELTEGKRGGGSRSSSSRGSSSSRSSSSSSSSSSSKSSDGWSHKSSTSFFGGSKSSGSSGKSWWSSSKTSSPASSRSGGGFKSSGGSGWGWSASKPRPSLSRDTVSRGIFTPSRSSSYYAYNGYGSGCGFGGCNTYTVYHYYPRSHYYSRRPATTTPGSIGPKGDQVSNALNVNDTLIYNENNGSNGTDASNATEVMEIADASKPLIIQDIAFFWDAKYLPSKDTKGCKSYSPANSNATISYCDVQEYSRCQRDLKELPVYKPESIFFKDGTNPSHLAWLCLADTTCCEWECCKHDSGWGFYEWILLCVFGFVLVYYGGKCCFSCCESWDEMREDRKYEKEREALNRQPSVEQ